MGWDDNNTLDSEEDTERRPGDPLPEYVPGGFQNPAPYVPPPVVAAPPPPPPRNALRPELSLNEQLADLGNDAVAVIMELLNSPEEKLRTKVETARWLIEKLTGKARQEVEVGAGTSLLQLFQKLDQLKHAGAGTQERTVLELASGEATFRKEEAPDQWMDDWVTKNIPGVASEKTKGEQGE